MQKKVNWKEFTSIEELQATLLSAIEHQAMAAIKKKTRNCLKTNH